jgi:CHAT domain-containing protein/tetratricopeptide (TPR) repeat protein
MHVPRLASPGLQLLILFLFLELGHAKLAWSEDAPQLKHGMLVLPFQAGDGIPAGDTVLGLAVHHVVEDMLTLHSDLEEVRARWHLDKLFPQERDFQVWVIGKGQPPTAVEMLGFRYLMQGTVRQENSQIVAHLELRDRKDGNTHAADLIVDVPTLTEFRRGVLNLWARADIPASPGQQEKMLWREEISLTGLQQLGHGLFKWTGVRLYRQGKPPYGLQSFREGVALAPQSYLLRSMLAWGLLEQKDYEAARSEFLEALKLNPAGRHAAKGMALIAQTRNANKQDEEYLHKLSNVVGRDATLADILNFHQAERESVNEASLINQPLSEDEQEEEEWLRKIGTIGKRDMRPRLADMWKRRADRASRHSQDGKALGYYQQALELYREVMDRDEEADVLDHMGVRCYLLHQYEKAIDYYEQALEIRRKGKDRAKVENTLNKLSSTHISINQYEKAIGYYEQALAIHRQIKDREGEAKVLTNLGHVYNTVSQFEKAIAYLEKALVIARTFKDRAGEGSTLNNLGAVYLDLGQYEKAIGYYERALAIRREVKDRQGEGGVLTNLGVVYSILRQYERAIAYYEQALTIHREVKNQMGEGSILTNLGAVYKNLREPEKAIGYYEQALVIHRDTKSRLGESNILANLGSAYVDLSQYVRAVDYFEKALVVYREAKIRTGEGLLLSNLMVVRNKQNQPRLAIFYGKQAVNTYQTIRGEIRGLDKDLQQGFLKSKEGVYRALADLLIAEGRLPEAEQVLRMLKEEELFEFVRRDQKAVDALARIALTKTEEQWAQRYLQVGDRLTVLGQEMQTLRAKPNPSAQEQDRMLALENGLQAARLAFAEFSKELAQSLGQSQAAGQQVINLETSGNLQSVLVEFGTGTVALYTVVGQEKTWVVLVTPEIRKPVEVSITATDLNRKVLALRESLQNPTRDPRPLAKELYDLLVKPFEEDLQTVGAQTLMWSLDGVLRYLPIAALYDGQQYLIERYQPVVFTLAGQQLLNKEPWQDWKGAGLGVSKPHAGFDPLPGVVEELRGIIREEKSKTGVLPGIVAMDEAFTERALQMALLRRYPVVHIASHFQFQPGDETDSFLLLGDGSRLSIAELKGYNFAGVDLFTLSACATALGSGGDGKEIESFAMLAQKNGAKAVVASLWPVADKSTKALMQTFYRVRQSKKGTSKATALRQAQLMLLYGQTSEATAITKRAASAVRPENAREPSDPDNSVPTFTPDPNARYAHPYYWAPFILIGNWR